MENKKNGKKAAIGIAMAAIMIASIFAIFSPTSFAAPSVPDGKAGIYYLVPEDSGANHTNSATIEVWVNSSLGDLTGGSVRVNTSNNTCGNITGCLAGKNYNSTVWDQGGTNVIEGGGESALMTFGTGTAKTAGTYPVGEITVRCENSTYCEVDLNFMPGLASGTYLTNTSGNQDAAQENGTFTCLNGPDLVITEVRGVATTGTNYTVNYTVENKGNVAAGDFWVNLTVDTSKNVTTEKVSGLAANGGTYTGNFSGYEVNLTGGKDNITVCADYNNTVTPELNEDNNCEDGIYPEGVKIMVIPKDTIIQPQDQFDVNITVNSFGTAVHSVQYYLTYDTSVLRAETQTKGPFLGSHDETIVEWNNVDQTNGIVSYAETRKGADGNVGDGTVPSSTVATIQFTAIGPRNATTNLSLYDVVIVKPDLDKLEPVFTDNGTVTINKNRPPVANGTSKHVHNNVAKKYPCITVICSCSTDPDFGDKGGNITYIRWAFGDGQYGTTEGLPENNCTCKEHKYESWRWHPIGSPGGHYLPFDVQLTVMDNGCPELSNSTNFSVNVYMAGDANNDGEVNIIDAAYVGRFWLDKCDPLPPDPCATCYGYLWNGVDADKQDRADLNNDCEINILDAAVIGANWRHTAW